jgi:RNA polymerase sigma factor (sigma-70 family)
MHALAESQGRGGPVSLPPELAELLSAADEVARQRAWDTFLHKYNRLLLHTARSTAKDREAAMDGYAYVLGKLREDDFRRLRAYSAGGRAKFTTWLVVITRRLVLDHRRTRYGRDRGTESDRDRGRLEARRRLADLISETADVDELSDSGTADPGRSLRADQRRRALAEVLGELDAQDQLLLNLRFVDGLSGREIAEIMGLPSPFHAYRKLKGVLASLRLELESRGIDDAEI